MPSSSSPIRFIDLTGDDDEDASSPRPPPINSDATPQRPFIPHPVSPLVLDLTADDHEEVVGSWNSNNAGRGNTHIHPLPPPTGGGSPLQNHHLGPERLERGPVTTANATPPTAATAAKPFPRRRNHNYKIHHGLPSASPTRHFSPPRLDRETIRKNWRELRKENPDLWESSRSSNESHADRRLSASIAQTETSDSEVQRLAAADPVPRTEAAPSQAYRQSGVTPVPQTEAPAPQASSQATPNSIARTEAPLSQQRHQATTNPTPQTERPPQIPQKRKQSSQNSQNPVFRSPPKTSWPDTGSMQIGAASALPQTTTTLQDRSVLAERPKTVSQSPPRNSPSQRSSTHMPGARVFNSFSDLLPSEEGNDSAPLRDLSNPSASFIDRASNSPAISSEAHGSKLPESRNTGPVPNGTKQSLTNGHAFESGNSTLPESSTTGAVPNNTVRVPNGQFSKPIWRKNCASCSAGRHVCDRVKPKCARCTSHKLTCKYDGDPKQQVRPTGPPPESGSSNLRRLDTGSSPVLPSQNSHHIPNNHGGNDSSNSRSTGQHTDIVAPVAESSTPKVRVKEEEEEDNGKDKDPDSVPDYLDATSRTRGWHHDGYRDVKEVFRRVALDEVKKRGEEFKEWPIPLQSTIAKVREKAENWAVKRFDYFVTRPTNSNQSTPNVNDVEWIQRKVSETFFDEASRAAAGTSSGANSPHSDRLSDPQVTHSPVTLPQTTREQSRSESSFEVNQNRSHEIAHSPRSNSISIPPRTISVPSQGATHETTPQQRQEQRQEQQSSNSRIGTRPSRAAAGTAASRITSQYTTYGYDNTAREPTKPLSQPKAKHPEHKFQQRHCSACDCIINVNNPSNWHVHLASQKHRENESSRGASEREPYCSACERHIIEMQWADHLASQEHQDNISGRTVSIAAKGNSLRHCAACDYKILARNWHLHVITLKHRENTGLTQQEQEGSNQEEDNAYTQTPIADIEQASPPRSTVLPTEQFDDVIETVTLRPQKEFHNGSHIESLAASIAILERDTFRPYQGKVKRNIVDKDARLDLLSKHFLLRHVDFAPGEVAMIKKASVKDRNGVLNVSQSMARAYAGKDFNVRERDWLAIKSSIQSLADNQQNNSPKFHLIESRIKDPIARPALGIASLLRHRELDSSAVGRNVETRNELRSRLSEDIKPWRSFRGASHDIVTVAWAPNSLHFAAGAAAHSNIEDLQYNRPCNLLYGDLRRNTLTELPDHYIDRQRLDEGPNSSQDVFNACDPKVYKTITSIKFQDTRIYTSSEDHTVKVWDLTESDSLRPRCLQTFKHGSSVTGLDISPVYHGLIATASQRIQNAISVFQDGGSGKPLGTFQSTRALAKSEWQIYPETISWGPSAASGNLLLAGFNAYGQSEISREGHLCLWDGITGQDLKPTPASQAIHTAAWHPIFPYFLTGGACGSEKTDRRSTKTVVRVWDHRYVKSLAIEYECPAQEMTDVSLPPLDQNIAVAGCVDCVSYVWDFRWPNQPLHQLRHNESIMPTGERDTGVMMGLWGTSGLYYSGSSDGEVRAWDIRRHPNDVLVNTIAQLDAGIQSGAFSPDGTHLLVGDSAAGIHLLSSTPWAPAPDQDQDHDHDPGQPAGNDIKTRGSPMTIVRAKTSIRNDDNPGTEGIEAAQKYLLSGQISVDPRYGPGKGPYYSGPLAKDHRESISGDVGHLKEDIYQQQPFSRSGQERSEFAAPIRKLVAIRKELLDKPDDDEDLHLISDQINGPKDIISSSERSTGHHDQSVGLSAEDFLDNGLIEEEWWSRLGEDEIAHARAESGRRRG